MVSAAHSAIAFAEWRLISSASTASGLLQWGRGHVTAEWAARQRDPVPCFWTLQWGRGHVTAECETPTVVGWHSTPASMGPRVSRDRGVWTRLATLLIPRRASMGPRPT